MKSDRDPLDVDAVLGSPGTLCYWACNDCLNRKIGVLWADDGTLARVWFDD